MGFLFIADLVEDDRRFESVTVSWGRIHPDSNRHRDRFDLILDSEMTDGCVGSLARVRAFVDPFDPSAKPKSAPPQTNESPTASTSALLERTAGLYRRWRRDEQRQWSHWTQDYIEYFGDRTTSATSTRFPSDIDDVAAWRSANAA